MSKFLALEAFRPSGQYELLPFRFSRFDGDTYLLTNMVGEYVLLHHRSLVELVEKRLSVGSDLYADLKAKQIIRSHGEQAPIDLLALKLRTRYAKLANFTNLHLFVVTLRCDHSCPYCQVSRQSEDKCSFDMTEEIAEKGLEFVFRTPNPGVKIEFQGGEPLLNFGIIKYVVLRAHELNRAHKKELQFVIATTLSLITEDVLAFCKTHQIILSSSLDGPETLHNNNRPRPGKNSYQKFVEGLKKARDTIGFHNVSALMTTTEASLSDPKGIIDEYLRHGFNGIFLRALSPYGFAIKTKRFMAYDSDRWFEFYKEGLEYIIELNKNGIQFVEHYASIILSKILNAVDSGFVDLMSPSGAGIAAIVFNYDGYIYPSDESRMLAEMGDISFRLGHLLENSYEEIILSDKLVDALEESFTQSVPMCVDCAYEPYCGSDPVYHHAIHGDVVGRKPESAFCSKNMRLFKHLIGLMESDREVKQLFLKWANQC